MTKKAIKDLQVGDVVRLEDGEGARIRLVERSRIFESPGGCWRLDWTVIRGPHKGEKVNDQHHPGLHEVELHECEEKGSVL